MGMTNLAALTWLRNTIGLLSVLILAATFSAQGQFPDSIPTGYLPDAAEEFWPAQKDTLKRQTFIERLKHIPVNRNKGFISYGLNVREGYENFRNYLWGIGPQDKNGFFLHRVLVHNDFRWNQHLRLFAELQNSFISGRNGGPRPVQDLNKLVLNQLFGEFSLPLGSTARLRFRVGKQSLNYGAGTLLDIRDANVRRSFMGYKLMLEKKLIRIDAFFMELAATREGVFDDRIDHTQKVAGFWLTKNFQRQALSKLDIYFLLIDRKKSKFNQGSGEETRNTFGSAAYFKKGNWFSYSEIDLQWGRFNNGKIFAWKIAPSIGCQFHITNYKPVLSIQGAISSGDKNAEEPRLQTFNPIYPKAIYYGFIDNAGSANLIVLHPKLELQLADHLKLTTGFYRFWRQQISDGIYAVNGSYLLPAANDKKPVGSMWDISTIYTIGNHFIIQITGSYYRRGDFLKLQAITKGNIHYLGVKATIRI
jgi:hypothetical protein